MGRSRWITRGHDAKEVVGPRSHNLSRGACSVNKIRRSGTFRTEREPVAAGAAHRQPERGLETGVGERLAQRLTGDHRHVVDLQDHVADLEPSSLRRALRHDRPTTARAVDTPGSASRTTKPNSAPIRSPTTPRGISARRTSRRRRPSARSTVRFTSRPGAEAATRRWSTRVSVTGRPSNATTRSPLLSPAACGRSSLHHVHDEHAESLADPVARRDLVHLLLGQVPDADAQPRPLGRVDRRRRGGEDQQDGQRAAA